MTSLRDIQTTVARHYGVSMTELISKRRAAAWPRHVAMHLCRELTLCSLPEIGRQFGDRDHTTVAYGVRRVQERCRASAEDTEVVRQLAEALGRRENRATFNGSGAEGVVTGQG